MQTIVKYFAKSLAKSEARLILAPMKATESNQVALTKQAAARNGITLTDAEASRHAAKIAANAAGGDGDEYGQDFWSAAKEYFLN